MLHNSSHKILLALPFSQVLQEREYLEKWSFEMSILSVMAKPMIIRLASCRDGELFLEEKFEFEYLDKKMVLDTLLS